MALRNSSPWWLSSMVAFGLLIVFIGERAFAHTDSATVETWFGVLLIVASAGLRIWVLTQTSGRQRRVELISLLCTLGVLFSLFLYSFTTPWGLELLGFEDEKAIDRFKIGMMILWASTLTLSVIPLLLIEISLGTEMRGGFKVETEAADATVDLFRVREMATSGLTIALATIFLMATCNIAKERNVRKDVSYFKTSSPGDSTVAMVSSMSETMNVLLFFDEVSETADEVEGYFNELARKTNNVVVERRDRLVDGDLAKEHKVQKPGTIVLVRGEKSEKFTINPDVDKKTGLPKARIKELREFDGTVQKAVMKVLRDKRIAYLSVGHGELNAPDDKNPLAATNPLGKSTLIKDALKQLNYQTKDFDGFGKAVPDDCDILFVLAPRTQLLDEELRAIDEYLAAGGSAVLTFDPSRQASLGLLEQRLGVHFDSNFLADDKEFMVRSRSKADHGLVLTNQFSSHASVTTMSRGKASAGILLIRPGSLDDVPFGANKETAKKTFVVRSMATAFRDLPSDEGGPNYVFDKGTEKRDRYNIVAAIEDKAAIPSNLKDGEKHDGMRVMVIADGEVFSDVMLAQIPLVQALLVDTVKWVGGEEAFAGEVVSEKDVRIEHTKSEDAKWFWLSLVGAPALILGLGLAFVNLGRRRRSKRRS